jgi:hypothetical protein
MRDASFGNSFRACLPSVLPKTTTTGSRRVSDILARAIRMSRFTHFNFARAGLDSKLHLWLRFRALGSGVGEPQDGSEGGVEQGWRMVRSSTSRMTRVSTLTPADVSNLFGLSTAIRLCSSDIGEGKARASRLVGTRRVCTLSFPFLARQTESDSEKFYLCHVITID